MGRTIEEVMLDSVPEPAEAAKNHRVVASVLSYVAESVVRGDQVFVIYDALLGGTAADRQALADLDEAVTPPLWERDGRDVVSELETIGVALVARGVVTISDIQPLIDHHVRAVLPDLSDQAIDKILPSCVDALLRAADRGEELDFGVRAAERVVEDWVIEQLDQVAEWCGLPELELVRQQLRFKNGKRADVVCRLTGSNEHFASGTWVVFELKAGPLFPVDVDQLVGYLRAAEDELAGEGDMVLGYLLGDGMSPAVIDRVRELDEPVVCQDLVSIGFHEDRFTQLRKLELLDTE